VKDLVNNDNTVIKKGKSRFITSYDAANAIKFARIKIRGDKIVKYKVSPLRQSGSITEYDLTGKQLHKTRQDKEKVIVDYTKE